MKQEHEMEADISAEYDEEDKPYQTEGDGEIATYESGSQDDGNFKADIYKEFLINFFLFSSKNCSLFNFQVNHNFYITKSVQCINSHSTYSNFSKQN